MSNKNYIVIENQITLLLIEKIKELRANIVDFLLIIVLISVTVIKR
jgi:hypothetical protein